MCILFDDARIILSFLSRPFNDAHRVFFLLAKCPDFRSIGQSRKYGGVEEVSTEPGVSGLLHYILDALVRSPCRSSPPAQLGGQVVHHVQFPTQINVAGAFGYVRSVEREWGIRDPSVASSFGDSAEERCIHMFRRSRSAFVPLG
ncbi:hypothetical protein RB195_025681 [Necator americanus]|uniref:Uncharacterized protein n=1 Tax=Necator americanus TaxID=51031 RepID=A0ABR1ETD9_NECAM